MSELCKNWSQWLTSTRFAYMSEEQRGQTLRWLEAVRESVIALANIKSGDTVIDVGTGTGLMAFRALELLNGSGNVIFSDKFKDCLDSCQALLLNMGIKDGYQMLNAPAEALTLPNRSVDKALMRSVMVHILDKQAVVNEIYRVLKIGGVFACFEPIIATNTKYWELLNPENIHDFETLRDVENEMMSSQDDPLTNFNQFTLAKNLDVAGFSDGNVDVQTVESTYIVNKSMVDSWMDTPPSPDRPNTRQRFLKYFSEEKLNRYIDDIKNDLDGKSITTKSNVVLIRAVK